MKPDVTIPCVVAMANFKGTLSNHDAVKAVAKAAKKAGLEVFEVPIADGGQGTLLTLKHALKGEVTTFSTKGPMGEAVTAKVLCLPNAKSPQSVFVESAETCGLHLITGKRDIMRASTFGLGDLIRQALLKWPSIKRVYVGLGDTGISDMGMGMLNALGYVFCDYSGNRLVGNAEGLRNIRSIEPPRDRVWEKVSLTILCDVMNPLLGPDGCARVFAPQKGATPSQVNLIEEGMTNFAELISKLTGHRMNREPMTGAAGGLGAAFKAFFQAELVQGAKFILDWIGFSKTLAGVPLVITGEGKTDAQTLSGKAPYECLMRASREGKKVVFVSGSAGPGAEAIFEHPSVIGMVTCKKKSDDPTESKKLLYEAALEALSAIDWNSELKEKEMAV